jgi:4-hydroxybenzoate-CoA ligase
MTSSPDLKIASGPYNAAADFIDRHVAEGRGGRTVFIDATRSITYAGLKEGTERFADVLPRLGIGRERRILQIMLDTIDFPIVFWGAIRAGVIPVPVNTLLTLEQWEYMIEDSRADAVVISSQLAERAMPMLTGIARRRHLHIIVAGGPALPETLALDALLAEGRPGSPPVATMADETAFWLYSSGSTGNPKGTRHVHTSLMYTARTYGSSVLGMAPDDVVFSAAKLFFAYGLGNAMTFPMAVGASAILMADRPTPDTVLATCAKLQPTIFYGVPTLYAALLADPRLTARMGSARLRLCTSAGEALPGNIYQTWREKVGVELLDGIGSTEMLHIFLSNRIGDVKTDSTGKPVPGYEARIIDETGKDVKPGEMGELIIRGGSAADGYWNQRDKTRRTFQGEWTYTGDKYYQSESGHYHCAGRVDDMFKVSGIWVSPFEVEAALISHPAVMEAAVVGKEDSDGLVKPKAFVVLKPGHGGGGDQLFDALKEHVKQKAGPWKYPRWVEVRAELPKTATGKIQRFKLRQEG